jgi:hypothetical protein
MQCWSENLGVGSPRCGLTISIFATRIGDPNPMRGAAARSAIIRKVEAQAAPEIRWRA